jgi:hypothetical protein
VKHAEHEIDLPAVMDLVLKHRAQPLPRGDVGAAWRHALAAQIGWREPAEDLDGLGVHPLEIAHYLVVAVGEISPVSWIPAGAAGDILSKHPALDRAKVSHEIAQRERTRLVRPLELIRRNAGEDARRAAANTLEIGKKLVDRGQLHVTGGARPRWARRRDSRGARSLAASDHRLAWPAQPA